LKNPLPREERVVSAANRVRWGTPGPRDTSNPHLTPALSSREERESG